MPSRPTTISTVSVTGPSGPCDRHLLGRVRLEQVAQPQQLRRVVPVHPVAEPDALLRLAGGEREHPLLAQAHELGDPERLDVPLALEVEVPLDVDLDPQALAVEAVLVALVLAEHGVEALVEVLVGPAPGVVDAHRVVGRDRAVEEAPARVARVLRAKARERPALGPLTEQGVLLGDEVGSGADGSEHRASVERRRGPWAGRGGPPVYRQSPAWRAPGARRRPRPRRGRDPGLRVSFRAMSTPQRAPRSRSAFAAAFLSLLFPGLGHAYAGAYTRALGFAAAPLLVLALGGGVVLRADRAQLAGMVANEGALIAIFIANIVALVYRVIAAVDAWQVARFLNATDASGGGRLGRARMPVHPLSIAGLAAVILVIGAGHFAVGRYDALAYGLVNCVFNDDGGDACGNATDPPTASETQEPADSADPGASADPAASPTAVIPTPDPSAQGTLAPTLPPWDGKERLNILAVGTDAREGYGTSFNTDTLIVVSIDPETKQVAMFQVPRDMVDVPVPENARSLWGSVYAGKINSWYNQNRNRTDLWPGKSAADPRPQLAQGHPRQALRPGHPLLRQGGLRGLPRRREHRRRRPGQRADAGLREPVPGRRGLPHPALHPRGPAAHDRRRGAPVRAIAPSCSGWRLRPRAAPAARPALAQGADERPGDHRQPAAAHRGRRQVRQDRHPHLGAAQAPGARGERGHQGHPVLRVLAALLRDGVPELAARLHHHAQRRPDPQGGQGGVLGESRARRPARPPRLGGRGRLGRTTRPGARAWRTGPPSTSPTTGSRRRRPTRASPSPSPRPGSRPTTAPRRQCPRP